MICRGKFATFVSHVSVLEMENDQTCSEAEKESKHHKEEVNKLEKEKTRLKEELSNRVAEISSLQTEISRYPTLHYSTKKLFSYILKTSAVVH